MSNNIITSDLQSLSIDDALVELFELELSPGVVVFMHSGVEEDLSNIKFHPVGLPNNNTEALANEYIAMPIMLDGVEHSTDGAANRPSLTIANVTSIFRSILQEENFFFEDLVGKKVTIRRTLAKYLVGGSSAATPFEFPRKSYYLDRVAGENAVSVVFELAVPYDVSGVQLPNRIVVGKFCSWLYQGAETINRGGCTWSRNSTVRYNGTQYQAYFTLDDNPLVSATTFAANSSAWSAGTYALDAFVTYQGKSWRSEISGNTSVPGTSINWLQVYTWTTWSAGASYTNNQSNFLLSNYVQYNSHIWRALRPSTGQTPFDGSIYWTRVDYCGKTLNACKSRFQFKPAAGGLPSAIKETDKILPFGAYPGTAKFN
jgi:lambda family phage minor tail protein L